MKVVLFKVKCVDADNSYGYLTVGNEYEVIEVVAPDTMGLINTRGKHEGKITNNEEVVYHLANQSFARWDASRFETINQGEVK